MPYKSLFAEERNRLFTLVLTNINRILQADPDLAMYNMQGTILTDHETPIIRNSDRSDIQLGVDFKTIWSRFLGNLFNVMFIIFPILLIIVLFTTFFPANKFRNSKKNYL